MLSFNLENIILHIIAAFMITKEVYFDLSGINDYRVGFTFKKYIDLNTCVFFNSSLPILIQ